MHATLHWDNACEPRVVQLLKAMQCLVLRGTMLLIFDVGVKQQESHLFEVVNWAPKKGQGGNYIFSALCDSCVIGWVRPDPSRENRKRHTELNCVNLG